MRPIFVSVIWRMGFSRTSFGSALAGPASMMAVASVCFTPRLRDWSSFVTPPGTSPRELCPTRHDDLLQCVLGYMTDGRTLPFDVVRLDLLYRDHDNCETVGCNDPFDIRKCAGARYKLVHDGAGSVWFDIVGGCRPGSNVDSWNDKFVLATNRRLVYSDARCSSVHSEA